MSMKIYSVYGEDHECPPCYGTFASEELAEARRLEIIQHAKNYMDIKKAWQDSLYTSSRDDCGHPHWDYWRENNLPGNACLQLMFLSDTDEVLDKELVGDDDWPFYICESTIQGESTSVKQLPSDEVITKWRKSKGWHNLGITELIKDALVELGGFSGQE